MLGTVTVGLFYRQWTQAGQCPPPWPPPAWPLTEKPAPV